MLVVVWALALVLALDVVVAVVAVVALFEVSSFSLPFSFSECSSQRIFPLFSAMASVMGALGAMAAVEEMWELPAPPLKILNLEVGLLFHSFQPTQQAIQTSRTDNLSLAIASEMLPFPQSFCPRSSHK